jgi:hypothetical protein
LREHVSVKQRACVLAAPAVAERRQGEMHLEREFIGGIGSNIDLLRRARPACERCGKGIVLVAMESGT